MNIKRNFAKLSLLLVIVTSVFTATYAMDLSGQRESTNVIDCRGGLVCGSACDSYRTGWQSFKCAVGLL